MENKNLEYFLDSKNLKNALIAVLIVFLAVATVYVGVGVRNKIKEGKYIGQEIETKNTISVSDTGEIFVKPDLAVINFSVITEAKSVVAAMSENLKKMNKIIDFMKNQLVDDKDVKTTNFNIYPRYEYDNRGKRTLVGYEINQGIEVKIRNLEKVGDIIRVAVDAGANQVGDLQFVVDKQDEFKAEARNQAIKKAKLKAKELAGELGIDLIKIINFSESGAVPPIYNFKSAAEFGMGGGENLPQIATGENKIEVTVTITYEIN